MCVLFYLILILLTGLYSYDLLEQYALSISSGNGDWTLVALGSEMLIILWPVLAATAVTASAATYLILRLPGSKNKT